MKKRGPAHVAAGTADPWRDLFDSALMLRVVDLVAEEFARLTAGVPATLQSSLQERLCKPLEVWLSTNWSPGRRLDLQAAQRLHDVASGLAERLTVQHPPMPGEADEYSAELLTAWQGFRAEAASWHVYQGEPERSRKARDAALQPRKVFKHCTSGLVLTPEVLRSLFAESEAAGQQWKAFAYTIKRDFGASEATQRRMLKLVC